MNRWQKWWSKAPVAESAAKAFPSDPERYAKLLGEELESPVAKDPSFAAEFANNWIDVPIETHGFPKKIDGEEEPADPPLTMARRRCYAGFLIMKMRGAWEEPLWRLRSTIPFLDVLLRLFDSKRENASVLSE